MNGKLTFALAAALATSACATVFHHSHAQTAPAGTPAAAAPQMSRPLVKIEPETPEQFLQKIFSHYTADAPGLNFADAKVLDRVFDPSVTKLLADPRWNAEGALNFDLVCVCQDPDVKNLKITTLPQKDPSHVTATASFDNAGEARQLTYDLVKNGPRYRIYDVKAEKPTAFDLRDFLGKPPAP